MRLPVAFSILLGVGLLAFLLGYVWIPADMAVEIVRYLTKPFFYVIHAVILFGLLRLVFRKPANGKMDESESEPLLSRRRCRGSFLLVGLAILGTLFLISREPFGFKVLSDEYIISAQAKSLHFQNTSDFPYAAFPIYGNLVPRVSRVDKRPGAFSALLGTVHDLTGYRVNNVFLLNTLIAFGFLWLLLYVGKSAAEAHAVSPLSLAWILGLALSLPLLAQNVNGAGFEVYNLLLILCSGFLGYRFLEEKGEGGSWFVCFLCASLLLFYTRYESILFVISVGGVILIKTRRAGKLPRLPVLLLLPVLLIPYLLRHRVFDVYPEVSWQASSQVAGAFSLDYFYENFGYAVSYLFEPFLHGSGSYLLAYLGLFSGVILLVRIVKKVLRKEPFKSADLVLLLYGIIILVNFLLLMCYHWGQLETIEVARLALPLFLLMGAAVYRVALRLFAKDKRILHGALAMAAVYLCLVAIPSAATAISSKRNYHARIDAWAVDLLQDREEPNPLVVSPVPLVWDLYEVGFYHPQDLMGRRQQFEFHWLSESFTPFILEKIEVDPATGDSEVVEAPDFAAPYLLETLGEYPYKPYHYARFSKIVGFKDPEARERVFDEKVLKGYEQSPIEYWFFMIP